MINHNNQQIVANLPTIAVFGIGYVGLVTAICLAKIGNKVIAVDNNNEKITQLKNGLMPIYEPGLGDLLKSIPDQQKPFFTTDADFAISQSKLIFIAVGTPQSADGSADLSAVFDCVNLVTKFAKSDKIIVTKSTVPAGTGAEIFRTSSPPLQKVREVNLGHT